MVSSGSQYILQGKHILKYILERVDCTGYLVGDNSMDRFKKSFTIYSASFAEILRKVRARVATAKGMKTGFFRIVHISLFSKGNILKQNDGLRELNRSKIRKNNDI